MTRIGVILGGAGFMDGSEIHEAVLAMLCLNEAGAEVICFAPDKLQTKVVDHATGREEKGSRAVLSEAARIARGHIKAIKHADPNALDAVVIPGGYGAALNLSNFALAGTSFEVDQDLSRLLAAMHEAKKPIGAICIAPVILAKVFGKLKPRLTIGNDPETSAAMVKLGAEHVSCPVTDCVVDAANRIVTTPAYMYDAPLKDVHQGIRKLAGEVVKLVRR